jgi:hypothetical protein
MEDDDNLIGNNVVEQLEFQNFMLSSAEEDLLAGKIPSSTQNNLNDHVVEMPTIDNNQPKPASPTGPIWAPSLDL